MGCTMREKHVRPNRKTRSMKPEFDPCCLLDRASVSKSIIESGLKPLGYNLGVQDSAPTANLNACGNGSGCFDENGWGYCTEEQLEEILLKNLEILYNEAVSKLVGLGYDEDAALKAILRNGHCYGGMDVLTNIMHNSLSYLNGSSGGGDLNVDETEPVFADLRQLEEYSLASMVYLLQQVKPHLSKGDAMWCLLMSDLHVARASAMDIPPIASSGNGSATPVQSGAESAGNNGVGVIAPVFCRFHEGWGFGNGGGTDFSVNELSSYRAEMFLHRDIECPKRFNLSPGLKSLLRRNVAAFAAGLRAHSKQFQTQCHSSVDPTSCGNSSAVVARGGNKVENFKDPKNARNRDEFTSVLDKLRDLNIDDNLNCVSEDQKDEMMVSLLNQIKDLQNQVKERKEWARQKAMQAAQRLNDDLSELKQLRMEREEAQRLKKGKQTLEDSTMKRLSEMENALRKASSQVDRANAAVRRLETENAEIRAEMEASKLSASESVTTCLEAAKREKKCLKKLLAWEKQKTKLQEDIAAEKQKMKELQRTLAQIQGEDKENESKWRQEQKAKEQALAQVEEEQRSKESAEATHKRRLEALRLKIEIDFQRHKDDLRRVEQELSRLQSTDSNHQSDSFLIKQSESPKPQGGAIAKLLQELDKLDDSYEKEQYFNRDCMICLKEEVSVVFLPCAHQVVCVSCNENIMGKKGKATCPCCRTQIQQRIRVFGTSY